MNISKALRLCPKFNTNWNITKDLVCCLQLIQICYARYRVCNSSRGAEVLGTQRDIGVLFIKKSTCCGRLNHVAVIGRRGMRSFDPLSGLYSLINATKFAKMKSAFPKD